MRSPPCRQSSVSLTAIHRDAFSSPMGRPSGEWLSDIRYFGGSARFGEQFATAWMGIAEAEQRTASGPRCLRWTQLELEWKRRWAFLFFHSLPTSTLRSCFIRRARDGLRATSTPSQACLRGRGRAPNRLHQTIRKLES